MTTVQVETSPFAMFPAQGDYSNTEAEKLHALGVLSAHADSADSLREVALMLELIDPPQVEKKSAAPVYCAHGHDQAEHGRTRRDGSYYCHKCALTLHRRVENVNAAGTRRRLRHLLLNGFTQRELGRVFEISAQSVSRISGSRVSTVRRDLAQRVAEFFDRNREEFHVVAWNDKTANARKDWVWAELYEDLDDPECEPVVPGQVAA